MKDETQEVRDSATAQIADARAFMLASVGTDGRLQFAIVAGTPADSAACVTQCRSMAKAVGGVMADQVIMSLQGADDVE